MLAWAQHPIESLCRRRDRGLRCMRNNSLYGDAGKRRNIWPFTNRYDSTSLLIISSRRQMTNPQSSAQSTPTLNYEELLEEMEKLDIADLLLIHRRVARRWAQFMKNTDIRRSQRLRVLQIRKIIEAAVNLEVKWQNQSVFNLIYLQ